MIEKKLYEHIEPMMNHAYMQKKWFEAQFKPICREYELKNSDLSVLLALHLNHSIKTAVDIEKFGELKRGNISLCVDTLCQRGYLQQQVDENDRRFKQLVVTSKADELLEKCDQIINSYCCYIYRGITKEEAENCDSVFRKMNENLDELYRKMMEVK